MLRDTLSEKATKIRKGDIEKVKAARVNASLKELEERGITTKKIRLSHLSGNEMTLMFKSLEKHDIDIKDLLREVVARENASASIRSEPTTHVQENAYRSTSGSSGKECKACKGLGYRTIYSTDPKAPFDRYTYGQCPDCGGTGRK